eukprot:INCI2665.2.p1 GENE.INCI2665.2~~INCI2665.2.p1  ORF type:complete len:1073 (-),score=148.70 INCI2665.2:181-3399(-)
MRFLQIVGLDDEQSSPAVLLANGQSRYLFNCGETLQRFGFQHKLRVFSRLDGIFVSQINAHTVGGMPGMMMTMSGTNISGTTVVGPRGLQQYLWATRCFFRRPSFQIRTIEAPCPLVSSYPTSTSEVDDCEAGVIPPPIVLGDRDEKIRVTPVVIPNHCASSESSAAQNQRTQEKVSAAEYYNVLRMNVHARMPDPRKVNPSSPTLHASSAAAGVISYVCHTADKPGKFHPAKARALGIPPGPMFSQLVRGVAVVLEDGTTVQPSQVVDDPVRGPAFAVVTCPSLAVLQGLDRNHVFKQYYASTKGDISPCKPMQLACIVHIAPARIFHSPEYRDWVSKFGPSTQHLSITGESTSAAVAAALCTDGQSAVNVDQSASDVSKSLHSGAKHVQDQPLPMFVSHTCRLLELAESYPHYFTTRATARVEEGIKNIRRTTEDGDVQDELPTLTCPTSALSAAEPSGHKMVEADYLLKYFLLPIRLGGVLQPRLARDDCVSIQTYQSELTEKANARTRARAAKIGAEASSSHADHVDLSPQATQVSTDGAPPFVRGKDSARFLQGSKVIFLGTGAAVPTKYRNVSCILVRIPRRRIAVPACEDSKPSIRHTSTLDMILDCGEGSYGQLVQILGVTAALHCVQSLSLVWISHMHADHHLGLIKILAIRSQRHTTADGVAAEPQPPLLVIGPPELRWWLRDYSQVDTSIQGSYVFFNAFDFVAGGNPRSRNETYAGSGHTKAVVGETTTGCVSRSTKHVRVDDSAAGTDIETISPEIGSRGNPAQTTTTSIATPSLTHGVAPSAPIESTLCPRTHLMRQHGFSLTAVRVLHPCNSFACILDFDLTASSTDSRTETGRFRLVYSGDTKPCPELELAGRDATLLIHEATFDSSLLDEAIKRHHSTVGQAVGVADRMSAYRTVLTHFSARYKRIPDIISSLTASDGGSDVQNRATQGETRSDCKESTLRAKYSLAFDHMTLRLDHLEGLPRLLLPLLRKLAEEQMDEDNQQAAECQGAAGCDSHHDKGKAVKRQRGQSQKKKRRESSRSKADKISGQEDGENGGADKRPRSAPDRNDALSVSK